MGVVDSDELHSKVSVTTLVRRTKQFGERCTKLIRCLVMGPYHLDLLLFLRDVIYSSKNHLIKKGTVRVSLYLKQQGGPRVYAHYLRNFTVITT